MIINCVQPKLTFEECKKTLCKKGDEYGSWAKVEEKKLKFDSCGLKFFMSDSYNPLFKLVLPEPIADYFELTSHRQEKESEGDTLLTH